MRCSDRFLNNSKTPDARIPSLRLQDMVLNPEVVRLLSPEDARRLMAIPVARLGNNLLLAVSDPATDLKRLNIRNQSQYNIRSVLATANEIAVAIEQYYVA